MGDDPRSSVTNAFGQTWDVKKPVPHRRRDFLLHADKNPTLTIMPWPGVPADYLLEEMRKGICDMSEATATADWFCRIAISYCLRLGREVVPPDCWSNGSGVGEMLPAFLRCRNCPLPLPAFSLSSHAPKEQGRGTLPRSRPRSTDPDESIKHRQRASALPTRKLTPRYLDNPTLKKHR